MPEARGGPKAPSCAREATEPRRQSFRLVLATVVLVEAAVILGTLGFAKAPLTWDGRQYHVMAVNLMQSGTLSLSENAPIEPTIFRTPGYSLFLAGVYWLTGRSPAAARTAQFLMHGLSSYLVYLLARRAFAEGTARLAGLLHATYLPLVFLATYLLNEALTVFLVLLLVLVLPPEKRGAPLRVFVAGLLGGIATLVRPTLSLLPCLLMGLFFLRAGRAHRRRALAATLLLVLGWGLPILPWGLRNLSLTGRFVPLASTGGHSFYWSVQQYAGAVSYRLTLPEFERIVIEDNRRIALADAEIRQGSESLAPHGVRPPHGIRRELLLNRQYAEEALADAKRLSPGHVAVSAAERLAYLWSTSDMAPFPGLFHRVVQIQWAVLAVALATGICLSRPGLAHAPLWLLPLYLSLIHLVFHSEPRYSIPGRPFLMVYSAAGLAWVYCRILGTIRRPREGR